jgi:hypothetical protein
MANDVMRIVEQLLCSRLIICRDIMSRNIWGGGGEAEPVTVLYAVVVEMGQKCIHMG